MILERGALLKNRYRIVEILGQGGMGSVYRAVDENLGVEVAVKDNLFTTEEYSRQFRREAVILANLRHPNLPRVTDHFVVEDQGQYLVMDYIEGEDLRQRMDRIGVLSEVEVITIGSAICDALTYLNTRNPAIIHRDIKPGNVKISPQGQIFLVDFGLAKVLLGTQATTTGARAMTPGYSPPEQYGTARTDQRSDIFSLGATLYAALTGAIPEDALSRAMEQAGLTPIREHNPRVSKRLATVIEKSLEVRPDDRYQDAEEFKQALRSALSTTKRRVESYMVEPPPGLDDRPIPTDGILTVPPISDKLPGSMDRSPLPLPISTPVEEPELRRPKPRPRKRGSRMGCWLSTVLAGLILIGSGLGAYLYNPALLAQLSTWIPVASAKNPLSPLLNFTQTPAATQSLPNATITNPVVFLPATASPTPTITPLPSGTTAPTATLTPVPTLTGGGGGQVAFASDKTSIPQIYIINLDGTGLFQVTDQPEGACQPDWSPDGQRLVFISPCQTNQEDYRGSSMFVINADGTGITPLPAMPGGDFDPAWSPDGARIAFTSVRNGGRPRIYVYNFLDNKVTRLSDEYSRDKQPAWSPDGKLIAFITTRRGPSQVWIMNADGQNQRLFSHSRDKFDSHPAWSQDGQVILFTQAATQGGVPKLAVASYLDTSLQEYLLTQDPVPMREGKYSQDGLWIAFEAWPQGGKHDIYVMTAGGASRRQLTVELRDDFDPAWRPQPK